MRRERAQRGQNRRVGLAIGADVGSVRSQRRDRGGAVLTDDHARIGGVADAEALDVHPSPVRRRVDDDGPRTRRRRDGRSGRPVQPILREGHRAVADTHRHRSGLRRSRERERFERDAKAGIGRVALPAFGKVQLQCCARIHPPALKPVAIAHRDLLGQREGVAPRPRDLGGAILRRELDQSGLVLGGASATERKVVAGGVRSEQIPVFGDAQRADHAVASDLQIRVRDGVETRDRRRPVAGSPAALGLQRRQHRRRSGARGDGHRLHHRQLGGDDAASAAAFAGAADRVHRLQALDERAGERVAAHLVEVRGVSERAVRQREVAQVGVARARLVEQLHRRARGGRGVDDADLGVTAHRRAHEHDAGAVLTGEGREVGQQRVFHAFGGDLAGGARGLDDGDGAGDPTGVHRGAETKQALQRRSSQLRACLGDALAGRRLGEQRAHAGVTNPTHEGGVRLGAVQPDSVERRVGVVAEGLALEDRIVAVELTGEDGALALARGQSGERPIEGGVDDDELGGLARSKHAIVQHGVPDRRGGAAQIHARHLVGTQPKLTPKQREVEVGADLGRAEHDDLGVLLDRALQARDQLALRGRGIDRRPARERNGDHQQRQQHSERGSGEADGAG